MHEKLTTQHGKSAPVFSGHRYIAIYSLLLFVSLFFGTIIWFLLDGKSLVWSSDGLTQHFMALSYWGTYLRKYISGIFTDGKFNFTLWDSSLGFGSDVLTTLHYYVIGDPLALISVFVPQERTEYLYVALIIVRIYLAGAAFSFFAKERNMDSHSILVGAITYCTCGYVLYESIMEPTFTNNLIFLPLICAGIDNIYENRSPLIYIAVTCVSAFSNFYFFYMLAILQLLYAILEYFRRYRVFKIKKVLGLLFRFIFYYLTGALLAGIVILPNILALFNSNRFGLQRALPIFYELYYYLALPATSVFSYDSYLPSAGTILALSPVSVACAILLFTKSNQKYIQGRIAIIISVIMLCLPVCGKIMNGMSYVSNRWIFAVPLIASFITSDMIPDFSNIESIVKKKYLLTVGIWIIILFFSALVTKNFIIIPILLLLLSAIIPISSSPLPNSNNFVSNFFLLIACVAVIVNGCSLYHYYDGGKLIADYTDIGRSDAEMRSDTPVTVISQLPDDGFARFDSTDKNVRVNSAPLSGTKMTSSYFSLASPYISNFSKEIALDNTFENAIDNLDGRTIPELLMSVRYYIVRCGDNEMLPYGYTNLVKEYINGKGVKYHIFENPNYLPLAYTYEKQIDKAHFANLTATQKQRVMLQAVVIEDSVLPQLSDPIFDDSEVAFSLTADSGDTKLSDKNISITKEDAGFTISSTRRTNSEYYLVLNKIGYTPANGNFFGALNSNNTILSNLFPKSTSSRINLYCGNVDKCITFFNKNSTFYSGIDSFIFNFGTDSKMSNDIQVQISRRGTYTYDSMQIISQPMDSITSEAAALKEDVLENVVIDGNTITGDIDLDTNKFLLYSIPYSKGWTAYVDGQKAELKNANIMFMGLELAPGSHHIVLKYCTPGLKTGIMVSAFGIAAFMFALLYETKKSKVGKLK